MKKEHGLSWGHAAFCCTISTTSQQTHTQIGTTIALLLSYLSRPPLCLPDRPDDRRSLIPKKEKEKDKAQPRRQMRLFRLVHLVVHSLTSVLASGRISRVNCCCLGSQPDAKRRRLDNGILSAGHALTRRPHRDRNKNRAIGNGLKEQSFHVVSRKGDFATTQLDY